MWQASPFAERTVGGTRYALVAVDPGVSALALRRDDGSLWCLSEGGVPQLFQLIVQLMNSGVEAFVAFNRAYEWAVAEAAAYDGPGDGLDDDEALDLAEQAADENSFWHIAAEELGYGMSV